ncbi:hypothetical protein CRV02_10925 [Arcobacter sp. CECT 8989]|uniref:hypothetical protein n=1 Tax=Arcobacter sp. CECT 8989 TaxID=2044509 RepID=UPI00100B13B3|nr:hypothetical protein [Arcobacter sp. CECT 8989]RXJ99874.1 hypothetical protein CRV02_10925 [Arcobacter sp. CECT 8989]
MTIRESCKNRIKPKLLREMKTEALLVFIRTTLEEFFLQVDNGNIKFSLGDKKDSEYISTQLRALLTNLQECVVNSTYLRSLIASSSKNTMLRVLAKKEEPLMVYYDSLVKGIEVNLENGQQWMPELVVICLLSEWVIEEEKSTFLYPFLAEINYLELIDIYDNSKSNLEQKERDTLMNMYKISSNLIEKLKSATYKVNTSRTKKRRKKNARA